MREALKALWSALVFTVIVGLVMMGLMFVIFAMAGDPLIEPASVIVGDREIFPLISVAFGLGMASGAAIVLAARSWVRRH